MPLFFIAFLRGKFCDILVTVMFYSGYIMIMSKNLSFYLQEIQCRQIN